MTNKETKKLEEFFNNQPLKIRTLVYKWLEEEYKKGFMTGLKTQETTTRMAKKEQGVDNKVDNKLDSVDKTEADNFYNALKDDQKSIIEFCENEIKEYSKLILLIKKGKK